MESSGCGCKEVYRFPYKYYLSLLLLYLFFFAAASLLFVHFVKCFSFLVINSLGAMGIYICT